MSAPPPPPSTRVTWQGGKWGKNYAGDVQAGRIKQLVSVRNPSRRVWQFHVGVENGNVEKNILQDPVLVFLSDNLLIVFICEMENNRLKNQD